MMTAFDIAVLVETSTSFGRGIIRGIGGYAKIHGPWYFHLKTGDVIQRLPPRQEWCGHGVIARIETPALARQLRQRAIPVVRIADGDYKDWPFVGTSQAAISQRVAEHFLERGFKRFAYIGILGKEWSELREQGFMKALAKAGYSCAVFRDDVRRSVVHRQEKLRKWILSLDKPVALMAGDDSHGRAAIEACRYLNIPVPETVSICGVDNNDAICTMTTPSLSSVPLNAYQIGYTAAQTLHRMLKGETIRGDIMNIEPLQVVTRQSSDLIAIDDPIVAQALKLIRSRTGEGLTVKTLLREISCSRRTLEIRFHQALGRSPHEEIRRVQLDRAHKLLLETDLKISEIARLCGFSRAAYLNTVFRRQYRKTPGGFRRLNYLPLTDTSGMELD